MVPQSTTSVNGAGPAAPRISVVIPCRNEVLSIQGCVQSLLHQSSVPGGFEIIVADGASDDGTLEVLRALSRMDPRVRIVNNAKRVTPAGMNVGISVARGEWIAIVGAHGKYAPDYLLKCLETAIRTGADNVGGAMHCIGTGVVQRAIAATHHSAFAVGGACWHDVSYEGPADTVFGGFYRRLTFQRIGLFDESLIRNQDDELNLRLIRSGGRIWHSPEIHSWYHPRNSLRSLFRQYCQYGYWKVRVIQKHRLPASWRHLVPGTFVLAALALPLAAIIAFLLAILLPEASGAQTWSGRIGAVGQGLSLGWMLMLAVYGLAVSTASLATARRAGWDLLPLLPAVFACYHVAYGWGFLRGILDFAILRRGPRQALTQITRAPIGT